MLFKINFYEFIDDMEMSEVEGGDMWDVTFKESVSKYKKYWDKTECGKSLPNFRFASE